MGKTILVPVKAILIANQYAGFLERLFICFFRVQFLVRVGSFAVGFVELQHFLKAHQKVHVFEWIKPFAHRV